jgi:hypothetical protein
MAMSLTYKRCGHQQPTPTSDFIETDICGGADFVVARHLAIYSVLQYNSLFRFKRKIVKVNRIEG